MPTSSPRSRCVTPASRCAWSSTRRSRRRVDQVRFFAGAARVLEGRSVGEYDERLTSGVRREPVGVCGAITPWNYPLMMAVWKWAPAVAAGNTVVLKPSELTPTSTARMAELLADVLPTGSSQRRQRGAGHRCRARCAPGGGAGVADGQRAGRPRRRHGRSRAAGPHPPRARRQRAGRGVRRRRPVRPRPTGSPPAPTSTPGRTAPRPPACWSPRSAAPPSSTRCAPLRRGRWSGDRRPRTPCTARSSARPALLRVEGLLDRLPSRAAIVVRRQAAARPGWFLPPTVVVGVEQDDEIVQAEIFGPVVTVQTFEDEDEALGPGQRRPLRPDRERLDGRPRPGHALPAGPRLRRGVGQHPRADGQRDAARRVRHLAATARTWACTAWRTTPASSTSPTPGDPLDSAAPHLLS